MLGPALDALLYRLLARRRARAASSWPVTMRCVDTVNGRLRVADSGGEQPVLLIAPDGPCVIEHYAPLVALLQARLRVVVVDLPGFGHSAPSARYTHRLAHGAQVLIDVLDALQIERAALALSCVNGYYAIAAARTAPDRISQLFLAQTPGLPGLQDWTQRMVPAPIRVPVLGQALNFLTRRKVAHGWYSVALAHREDRAPFRQIADTSLQQGGCYCFAGVVQGMSATRGEDPLLRALDVPATLVWGAADRSHRHTDPETLRAHLPQLRIVRYEDCGHFPELEAPQRYAALVLDTLFPATSSPTA